MGVVFFLGLPVLAFSGGTIITTIADGPWSSASTWDIRVPITASEDQAHVRHTVDVTTNGQETNQLLIGIAAGAGTVNVLAGSLAIDSSTSVGFGATGTLNLTGGTITTSQGLTIGQGSTGTVEISGGSLSVTSSGTGIIVGQSSDGTLKIVGSNASISISAISEGLDIGSNGTLTIEPTANGSAGLSKITINAGSVSLVAGSTLTLDLSSYTPSVGDKWDVISSPGTISGSFTTLSAPAGYTITQSTVAARGDTPQKIVIEVTGVPTSATWVEFGFGGSEDGSETNPWNTLAKGLMNVAVGGIIKIKGDTGSPTTSETLTIMQDVTLQAPSGTVTIGVAPPRRGQSGFVSRGSRR